MQLRSFACGIARMIDNAPTHTAQRSFCAPHHYLNVPSRLAENLYNSIVPAAQLIEFVELGPSLNSIAMLQPLRHETPSRALGLPRERLRAGRER